ncbi:conjugal transfer protein TrbP [Legionella beliardensis]|uniref:Conjugal transfer protein TrbP n=1 Tax=Legionella beliardensis TaxID=91822 RepID=A0A378I5L0_9GAMM|nr:TraX family protein [Legionella beliardensis]STX30132.1 conjugal transfer protein TrbP [Legionella beliardensis]
MYKFPVIKIQNGTVEAIKWLALLFMTIDHVNRVFFNGSYYAAFCIGRLAMPLFAFIFAYNLARSQSLTPAIYFKTARRLLLFGALATPAYMQMLHLVRIIPLNIMFTLLIAATTIFFYSQKGGQLFAFCIFFLGSLLVEFSWPGVALCVSFWLYLRNPTLVFACLVLISYVLLGPVNGNNWAMATIPIILGATIVTINVPRLRYVFWIYYPLHLTVLVLVKLLIQR